MVNNTIAVKTSVSERRNEWREVLVSFHDEVAPRGANWAFETAFSEALLALLDDLPAQLSEGNPYQPYLQRAIESIKQYRKEE